MNCLVNYSIWTSWVILGEQSVGKSGMKKKLLADGERDDGQAISNRRGGSL